MGVRRIYIISRLLQKRDLFVAGIHTLAGEMRDWLSETGLVAGVSGMIVKKNIPDPCSVEMLQTALKKIDSALHI